MKSVALARRLSGADQPVISAVKRENQVGRTSFRSSGHFLTTFALKAGFCFPDHRRDTEEVIKQTSMRA